MRWPKMNVTREQVPFLRALQNVAENHDTRLGRVEKLLKDLGKSSGVTSAATARAGVNELQRTAPKVVFDEVYGDGIAATNAWKEAARIELPIPDDRSSMIGTVFSKSTGDVSSMLIVNGSPTTSMDSAGYWQIHLAGLDPRSTDPDDFDPVPVTVILYVQAETPQNVNARLSAQAFFYND